GDLAFLLRVVTGLLQRLGVLDDVLRSLHHHEPRGVVACTSRPSGDLVEFPGLEVTLPSAVEFGQSGEHDGADGYVDRDAERVRTADEFQQPGLGELLHQPAVFRQHARVVHADAVPDQPRQRFTESCREPESADHLGDGVLLRPAADVDAAQRLGTLDGGSLREVHDVDRRLTTGQQSRDGLVHRSHRVPERQRYGSLGGADDRGGTTGPPRQILLEEGDVTQRRRHQHELGVGELQQGYLPCPTTVRVGVEVEFVHHHLADIRGGTVPQRHVGQDLRSAANYRRVRINTGVAGEHPDVRRTEHLDQRKELLGNQCFDRRGVEGAVAVGQRGEVRTDGDKALAGSGRGREDDVRAGNDLDQRLFLRWIEFDSVLGAPRGERLE